MNSLHVGTGLTIDWLRSKAEPPFLLITADARPFLAKRVRVFDPRRHHFNPLNGITPERAADLADIVYASDPGGETTLTVRNGKRALARMLAAATRLDRLTGDRKDPAQAEALAAVDALLFFPTLKSVLCSGKQFDFSGSVVAEIDPAILGPKQALALALLLIGQHKGQIVVPDGGRYARPLHLSLMDQDRLTVAVNTLAELGKEDDPFRLRVEAIADKEGRGCVYKDAVVLASYFETVFRLERREPFIESVPCLMADVCFHSVT